MLSLASLRESPHFTHLTAYILLSLYHGWLLHCQQCGEFSDENDRRRAVT